jgi:hypothetical protein
MFTKAHKIEDYLQEPTEILVPEVVSPVVVYQENEECTVSCEREDGAEKNKLPVPALIKHKVLVIPKFVIERKEFPIPIHTVNFQIIRKTIKINLPRIKMNLVKLKRIMYLTGTVALAFVIFFAAFVAKRIVDLTDGNYLNNLIEYKMGQEIDARVLPVANKLDILKNTVDVMEANQAPIYNYVTKKKIQKIKIVNGRVVSVKEWEQ